MPPVNLVKPDKTQRTPANPANLGKPWQTRQTWQTMREVVSWWHSQKNAENFAKNMKKIELCKKISLGNFMNDIVVCLKNSDVRMLAHVKNCI